MNFLLTVNNFTSYLAPFPSYHGLLLSIGVAISFTVALVRVKVPYIHYREICSQELETSLMLCCEFSLCWTVYECDRHI